MSVRDLTVALCKFYKRLIVNDFLALARTQN